MDRASAIVSLDMHAGGNHSENCTSRRRVQTKGLIDCARAVRYVVVATVAAQALEATLARRAND